MHAVIGVLRHCLSTLLRPVQMGLVTSSWYMLYDIVSRMAALRPQVSVRILGGLMALGYQIGTIMKRTSAVFSDDRLTVKVLCAVACIFSSRSSVLAQRRA